MRALPIAVAMALALGAVVWAEGLYRSDAAFLAGVLIGAVGYWTVLEAGTIISVGRLLKRTRTTRTGS